VIERGGSFLVDANSQVTVQLGCQTGELATGGGYNTTGDTIAYSSHAAPGNAGWIISVFNSDDVPQSSTVYAECTSLVP
jgi:hypothetical protein